MNVPTPLKRRPKPTQSAVVASPTSEAGWPHARFSPELVMISDPQGPRSEAIRALRTHIVAQHIQAGRRALAVCAATSGVGCSFVAANLAVALSQMGVKTILIDADLRQPAVQDFILADNPELGLRQCLGEGDATFEEAVVAEVLPNLSVLFSGGVANNPLELLSVDEFQNLLDVCMRDFEVTIVDTPPTSRSSDARRISNVVGYSLVVARRDKSLVDDVKALIAELQGVDALVVGTVLNEA